MVRGLEEWLRREPFEPFVVILTSGDRYEISNPFLIAIGKTTMHIYQPQSDRWSILRLDQLAAVNSLESSV